MKEKFIEIKEYINNLDIKYKIIALMVFLFLAFIFTRFILNSNLKDRLDSINYKKFSLEEELNGYNLYNERNTYFMFNNILDNLFSAVSSGQDLNGFNLDNYYEDSLTKKYSKYLGNKKFNTLIQEIYDSLTISENSQEIDHSDMEGTDGITGTDSDFYTIEVYKKGNYYAVKYKSTITEKQGYILFYLNDENGRYSIFYIE